MKITFTPLAKSHFPLLLKWLETPHVKTWWDQDVEWTPELIQEKYTNYVEGYKREFGIAKTIKAYIICVDRVPIGYIQIYNAYDFARSKLLTDLPSNLAAFDVLIGEESYLKQGLGSQAIEQFLKEHGNSYTHVFADPKNTNLAAIRAYEKAGFKKIIEQPDVRELWMIRQQTGRPCPLRTIQKLVQERYLNAKAIFWAGSVSQEQGFKSDAPKDFRTAEASTLPKLIEALEQSLLDPSVRQSTEQLNKLIADDFLEFGSSGRVYNKQACIRLNDSPRKFSVSDFNIKELSKDVMLATYNTIEDGTVSLRSSIWKRYGDEWQLTFHQGTKTQGAKDD